MITVELNGPSGNIFAVLGLAKKELSEARGKEMCDRVFKCHSYDEALTIIGEYVCLNLVKK